MGCTQSAPPVQKMRFDRSPTSDNFGKDKSLNKADFIYTKRGKETLIKSPREINGQQFIIEECDGSDMFLIDHMAMLTIDFCKDCRIVSGPVASSVFIRNCEDCVIVIACQQLRLRDCKNLTIFLHSTTGPIIESSSNISIGCFNYAYFGLEANLTSAEMSIWENEWYSVYDFTPAQSNFKLLPSGDPSTYIETVIPSASALIEDGLCSAAAEDRATPLLYGPLDASEKSTLLVFLPKHSQVFRNLLEPFVQKSNFSGSGEADVAANWDKLVVLRTTKKKISSGQLSTLIGGEKLFKQFVKAAELTEIYAGVELICCEVSCAKSGNEEVGRVVMSQLTESLQTAAALHTPPPSSQPVYLHWSGAEADEKSALVFEQWRVHT